MTNPPIILAIMVDLPVRGKRRIMDSFCKLSKDVMELLKARSTSPSSLISPPTTTTEDPLRHEVAPPPDTSYPRFAAVCYRQHNICTRGLNVNIEAPCNPNIRSRCFLDKLRRNDTSLRGILSTPRECPCKTQKSPEDSAYDSSSNCSFEDLQEDVDDVWSDEEDDYVPSAAESRQLAELEPAILHAPHAEAEVVQDRLKRINREWNQFYSGSSIYSQSCKLCCAKKSVRVRDSSPRVGWMVALAF
jgi:hypothetical protein